MEELAFNDIEMWHSTFKRLRSSDDPLQRKATKWSDPEQDEETGKWKTVYHITYPKAARTA